MKKLSVLFLALFVFAGCGPQETPADTTQQEQVMPGMTQPEDNTEEISPEEVSNTVIKDIEKSQLDEALSKDPDLKNCDPITDAALKAVCVRNVVTDLAIEQNDPTVCEQIASREDADRCKTKVSTRNAN